MKAVRIHEYGGPEVLVYEDAPRPEPAQGEALVRVYACAVNPVDWKIRAGELRDRMPYALPMILGWDVSGEIEQLGPGATGFAVGDAVYSRPDIGRDGAYAEYIAIRTGELARKPRTLSHVEAAAVPLAALTAWQVLFDAPPPYSSLGVTKGETVLIHGAAGGVGTFAVQLAKWKGAKVIATASEKNEQFLRTLGADQVIDYHKQPFEEVVRDVDAVLDTVGGSTLARSWGVLKRGGIIASTTMPLSEEEASAHHVRIAYAFVQPNASQLGKLAGLLDEKAIRPIVSQVLPLAEARKAHELSQDGHVRGKLVLEVRRAP
jgi:NADPH:quinone reductase-like Zn-dependent oxidoreductase